MNEDVVVRPLIPCKLIAALRVDLFFSRQLKSEPTAAMQFVLFV